MHRVTSLAIASLAVTAALGTAPVASGRRPGPGGQQRRRGLPLRPGILLHLQRLERRRHPPPVEVGEGREHRRPVLLHPQRQERAVRVERNRPPL